MSFGNSHLTNLPIDAIFEIYENIDNILTFINLEVTCKLMCKIAATTSANTKEVLNIKLMLYRYKYAKCSDKSIIGRIALYFNVELVLYGRTVNGNWYKKPVECMFQDQIDNVTNCAIFDISLLSPSTFATESILYNPIFSFGKVSIFPITICDAINIAPNYVDIVSHEYRIILQLQFDTTTIRQYENDVESKRNYIENVLGYRFVVIKDRLVKHPFNINKIFKIMTNFHTQNNV